MMLEIKENSWINTVHVSGVQILEKKDTHGWHVVFHLAGTTQSLMSGTFNDAAEARKWLLGALEMELIQSGNPSRPGPSDSTGFNGLLR